jgi:Domain of unknown function (DUF4062)
MADSRKIVRIFLGSPGDLNEERRAAKSVVDEFNSLWADETGYHIELMGWEDTVASYGRPQATINQDLERCELFVGMIWKRWGTPPDTIGIYSSGFEEELETSIRNRKSRGKPDISLLFKNIDKETLRDPGDQLKQVIALKDSIVAKKELYFEEFDDVDDFKEKIRRRITKYVQRLRVSDSNQLPSENASPPKEQESKVFAKKSVISDEGTKFLRDVISTIETMRELSTAVEVARFRLLGVNLRIGGNDELILGIHDANLIFLERENLKLGSFEVYGLIESGLANFESKSTPLWYWLAVANGLSSNLLSHLSLFGTSTDRIGALHAMLYLGELISTDKERERDVYLTAWFSKESSNEQKVAALGYLCEFGREEAFLHHRPERRRGIEIQATTADRPRKVDRSHEREASR